MKAGCKIPEFVLLLRQKLFLPSTRRLGAEVFEGILLISYMSTVLISRDAAIQNFFYILNNLTLHNLTWFCDACLCTSRVENPLGLSARVCRIFRAKSF